MFWDNLEGVDKAWFLRGTYKTLVKHNCEGWRNWEESSRKELCVMFVNFFVPGTDDFDKEKSE